MEKQLTLNDCNLLDKFVLLDGNCFYRIQGFADFVDEENGQQITMAEVYKIADNKIEYMLFETKIKKIVKGK